MPDTPLPAAAPAQMPPRLSGAALRAARQALAAEAPRLRARDAAARLGVSEAELLAAEPGVFPLRRDWHEIIAALEPAGPLMALTRNESIVHEKTGIYEKASGGPQVGLTLGADIDLRLFYGRWRFGFATGLGEGGESRPSLQFFDAHGMAVHKVFAVDGTDRAAFAAIAGRFRDPEADLAITVKPEAAAPAAPDPATIDAAGLREGWDALQDTHEFHDLLKRFGLDRHRLHALELAGPSRAAPVPVATLETLMARVAETGLPIMVFVGNPGCIQIHTGPVVTLKTMGEWFNVLDPGFNLHIRSPDLARAFIVRKPTRDGAVTSLEIFDTADRLVASLFGKRKPGEAEDAGWRDLVEGFAGQVS